MPNRFITGLRRRWRKRFGVLPLRNSLLPLSEWFGSALGSLLVKKEQELIDEELRNLFGYHLLQLSVARQVDLTQASRISHRFALYPCLPLAKDMTDPDITAPAVVTGLADFNHLPLSSNSMDLVLLHHILDYSQKPHQVLREASSVLISQGHLVVVGFNPWSFFGVWRWLMRFVSRAPQWRHQSLRLGRVLDWLTLLDFEPIVVKQAFYCAPCYKPKVSRYLQWVERWGKRLSLPGGCFYLIVARKDSLSITPIKPQWQGYAGLRGWGVTKILGRATRGREAQAHYIKK